MPATPRPALDRAVADLAGRAATWSGVDVPHRIELLARLHRDFSGVAQRWAEACIEAERLPPANPAAGEEWLVGPYFILRNLRLLATSLEQIGEQGYPTIPGPIEERPGGRVAARIFPDELYDRILYPPGMTAEVWMLPGVTAETIHQTQAVAYRETPPTSGVCLVLGAGNVSSIGPMDALYKLFVENRVVVYKVHPVNDYLGPLMEEGFASLVDNGFLRLVYGGAEVGAYLTDHDQVDEIHITGSDKTVEAIAFGTGEEGERRKRERRPRLAKPISSELGNVSPVIVVPGPWSPGDLAYHAESVASMLTNNAGFNCNAARVVVQDASWRYRDAFLDQLRAFLAKVPTRAAWYPGAADRWQRFADENPKRAELFGRRPTQDHLPWMLVAGVPPEGHDELCFRTEAFTGVIAETALEASSVVEFIDRAVEFCNERLWGTLSASILVHNASLGDREVAAAVDRALADLRYGTVTINQWAAVGYGLVSTPWGAYPGHDLFDIQSGTGVVHNTLMFDRVEKVVVRVPFRVWPKAPWFATHRTAHELGRLLTELEIDPSPAKLPKIVWTAMRG